MSLLYRYIHQPLSRPAVALGGRFVRPRPIIPVALLGPTGSTLLFPLVDTGADDTLFHDDIAAAIGVDLTNAPHGSGSGIGSTGLVVRFAEITLRIGTNQERREWQAWVGFTSARLPFPVVGFGGFLQFFDAQFRGGLEELELTINALYPGK